MGLYLIGGDAARFAPNVPWGWEWEYNDTSQVNVIPRGIDGYGYVPMSNNTTGERGKIIVATDSTLTLDISTAGEGGLHDDHTEAANTGYDIYFAGGTGGAIEGGITVFAVPTGTAITPAKIADLTGGTWTYWSAPAFFVYNQADSNYQPFWHTGPGEFTYIDGDDTDIRALGNGTNNTVTLVDLSNYVPEDFAWIHLYCEADCTDGTSRDCSLFTNAGGSEFIAKFERLWAGEDTDDARDIIVRTGLLSATRKTPATTFYYQWSTTPTLGGLVVWVRGAKLRSYAQG